MQTYATLPFYSGDIDIKKKTLHSSSGSKDSLIKLPEKLIKVKPKFNVLLLPYCINESMMSKGKIERNNQY